MLRRCLPPLVFLAVLAAVYWRLWTPIPGARRTIGLEPGAATWWLGAAKILAQQWIAALAVYGVARFRGALVAAAYGGGLIAILAWPLGPAGPLASLVLPSAASPQPAAVYLGILGVLAAAVAAWRGWVGRIGAIVAAGAALLGIRHLVVLVVALLVADGLTHLATVAEERARARLARALLVFGAIAVAATGAASTWFSHHPNAAEHPRDTWMLAFAILVVAVWALGQTLTAEGPWRRAFLAVAVVALGLELWFNRNFALERLVQPVPARHSAQVVSPGTTGPAEPHRRPRALLTASAASSPTRISASSAARIR